MPSNRNSRPRPTITGAGLDRVWLDELRPDAPSQVSAGQLNRSGQAMLEAERELVRRATSRAVSATAAHGATNIGTAITMEAIMRTSGDTAGNLMGNATSDRQPSWRLSDSNMYIRATPPTSMHVGGLLDEISATIDRVRRVGLRVLVIAVTTENYSLLRENIRTGRTMRPWAVTPYPVSPEESYAPPETETVDLLFGYRLVKDDLIDNYAVAVGP